MIRPGDYITAKCGRCNDVTGHVVMVVLNGVIMKVECKACGSVHKYRETKVPGQKKTTAPAVRHVRAGQTRDAAVELHPARSSRTASQATSKAAATARRSAAKMESAWQEAMVRHNVDRAVPYSMAGTFTPGELLEHPSFGRGEVIAVTRPDKIDVLFQEGVKTLRCKL